MSTSVINTQSCRPFTFVDVFAGCGGLSLGLIQSGWRGLFAIERDQNAFATLHRNLIAGKRGAKRGFNWPTSIPIGPLSIEDVLGKYRIVTQQHADCIDLLVGGPPCQGFSTAGRRDPDDPRNQLVRSYLQLVDLIRPRMVLIENVKGITADFVGQSDRYRPRNYAAWLQQSLAMDYDVYTKVLDTSTFGVPQRRFRFFIIAIRKELATEPACPFSFIESKRVSFLETKSIRTLPVPVRSAISDLRISVNGTRPSRDTNGFEEIRYKGPRTNYQKLMNQGVGSGVSDTRLARHSSAIEMRFKSMIKMCHSDGRLNVSLSPEVRESFGLRKRSIRVLDPDDPSPTVTSMPDDLIHYEEPRCLTVRENARLQSFPDWFEFQGKYTTGGDRRRKEVPRFTQVANAVPPLVAEAIGGSLIKYAQRYGVRNDSASCSSSS